jgi:SAM-dependent methyltransferase
VNPEDLFAQRYLSGRELWGDDFGEEHVAAWFEDEREAYANLGVQHRESSAESYGYHGLNAYHGFRHLPDQRFVAVLGIGSSFGGEFLPILESLENITVLEPSHELRSARLGNVPLTYVDPVPSGAMPFPDSTFDLVLCLGVLHHLANVSYVVGEVGRVMKPNGWALIREPVVSLGDWRTARKAGLTERERGIPRQLLENAVVGAGMHIRRSAFCVSPITHSVGRVLRANLYASQLGAAIDRVFALVTAWNYRYHATRWWEKLRPSSVFVVAQRTTG